MKPAKTENPYVVVPEDHLTKVLDLLDDIAKERKDIIELLSKAQGLDVASLQQAVASQSESIANRVLKSIEPARPVENVEEKPWKKLFFQGSLVAVITLVLLSLGVTVYSLINLNSLDRHWQNLIQEKMKKAVDIEQSIDFFKDFKEAGDAGQSD